MSHLCHNGYMMSPKFGSKIPTFEMHAGMRLAAARQMAGLTQDELAAKFGASRRTISRWENNPEGAPPMALIGYVIETDVNYGWLMTGRADVPNEYWLKDQTERGALVEDASGLHEWEGGEQADPSVNLVKRRWPVRVRQEAPYLEALSSQGGEFPTAAELIELWAVSAQ